MRRRLKRFAEEQTGITAIEASLAAAILSIAAVAALEMFGEGSVAAYAGATADWVMARF